MKKIIDLHGLSHEKALIKVEDFLLDNSFSNLLELELITGNSPLLQKKIINQILNKYQYTFYIPEYNRGMMYITDSKIK
jgi:DNA-nicking Smr family endonuclease